jgi:hypothetical protein
MGGVLRVEQAIASLAVIKKLVELGTFSQEQDTAPPRFRERSSG